MNELNTRQKPKNFAAFITVAVCGALMIAAIVISIFNPGFSGNIPAFDRHGRTHYNDMVYEHIDVEAIIKDINELCDMIAKDTSYSDQSAVFKRIDTSLGDYYTMSALIEIKFFSDPSNKEYSSEYNYLESFSAQISDKVYELMDAIALSSHRSAYERNFFGLGYFNDWQPRDYSDEVVALMEEETRITNKYLEEIADPSVTLSSGKTVKLSEVDFSSITQQQYDDIIKAYNQKFSEMYAEIVKVRLEIAQRTGISYAEIAHENLNRDYSPEDVDKYLEGIALHIVPLYYQLQYDPELKHDFVDTLTSFTALKSGAYNMGGVISEAFDYMFEYGLYDMSYSETKSAISFQTYIQNYNSPFVFVSPVCNRSDLMTFSHEFGHFVDSYYNLDIGLTIDNTEIASQAMALILPLYAHGQLTDGDYDYLKAGLCDVLETYLQTGFTGLFEQKVYRLAPEEVTAENLNRLARECAVEMGVDEEAAYVLSTFWFETQHIFIAPMYTIGYSVSCDVALQVLEAELKAPGKGGADAYMNVIDRDVNKSFTEDIKISGFADPFDPTRLSNTAEFIKNAWEGKLNDPSQAPNG